MPKALHVSIIIVIIVAIFFTATMLILRYDEKGETNMPFDISKIAIISTVDAKDIQDKKNVWSKSVGQDNDIYIYIDKNKNYKKIVTIEKIVFNNFKIDSVSKDADISIYKPTSNSKEIFENVEEYKSNEMEFIGEQSTNMKKMHISNQGGIIAFRVANENLGKFVSNGEKTLKYKDLLKKIKVNEEDLKIKISFDVTISLRDGKKFVSNINLSLPAEKVVEEGKSSVEITDVNCVFKRLQFS